MHARLALAFPLALAMALPPASAQSVYKCSRDGRTSYQSTPCAGGGGEALKLPADPDPSEVAAARGRAASDAAQADAYVVPARTGTDPRMKASGAGPRGAPELVGPRGQRLTGGGLHPGLDCAGLTVRLQKAYDRHAGSLAAARHWTGPTSKGSDDVVGRAQLDILDAQAQMRQQGCPIPP